MPRMLWAISHVPSAQRNDRMQRREFGQSDQDSSSWLLHSGAARHCSGQMHRFRNLVNGHFGCIKVANGTVIPVTAKGDIDIHIGSARITLHNVLYVPQLSFNIISVKRLWKDNKISTTFGEKCFLKDKNTGTKHFFPGQVGSVPCWVRFA